MANLRTYPTALPSTAPGTGRFFYEFLMRNIGIPAASTHTIWYEGEKAKLAAPDTFAFRGAFPDVGSPLELITLAGKPLPTDREVCAPGVAGRYLVDGTEQFVLVADLATAERERLGIPTSARDKDKVFNVNFKTYAALSDETRMANELPALSLPKSISSFIAGVEQKAYYSEEDVVKFLERCFTDLSSQEMMHVLHGNHAAWAASAYLRSRGHVEGDLLAEFHGQQPTDFYVKDIGTVLPAMFFALASLGQDPVQYHDLLDIEIWGARDAATYMQQFRSPVIDDHAKRIQEPRRPAHLRPA